MPKPTPVLLGYFPKIIAPRTAWFKNPVVRDICSVSNCIAKGPDGWINQWRHNTSTGLFDHPESARRVLPPGDTRFTLLAYRVFPILFDGETTRPWDIVSTAEGDLAGFEPLGYDIVSRSGGTHFECSPLSCNNGCDTFPVNPHCLLSDEDDAWTAAKRIAAESKAQGTWEPGPYALVDVYRARE
jgi:hypothetical protein